MWLAFLAHTIVILDSTALRYNFSGFPSRNPTFRQWGGDTPAFYYGFAGPGLPRAVKPSPVCRERECREKNWWVCNLQGSYKGLSGALGIELLPLKQHLTLWEWMKGGVLSVKVISDPLLKGTICYTMKYIQGKMHMFFTINTYANLAKIFEGEKCADIIHFNIIECLLVLIWS